MCRALFVHRPYVAGKCAGERERERERERESIHVYRKSVRERA